MAIRQLVLATACAAVAAAFAFDLAKGFRTGRMRFRLRYNIKEGCRSTDPVGFWAYALFNIALMGLAALALWRLYLQRT